MSEVVRTSGEAERDPLNYSIVSPADEMRTIMINRISWGAVFAGAAVALVIQLILNLLAVGVGLGVVSPVEGNNPSASSFSLAAGLWFIASVLFSSYVGGHLAGRLCGKPVESTAGYHGLTSWAVSTLVMVYLLTSAAAGIIGGAANMLGSVAGGLGKTAGTAVQSAAPAIANANDPFGAIERQVRNASGGSDPAALRDAAVTAMRAAVTSDPAAQQDAREKAAQALAKAQNISIEDARTRVGDYENQYHQAVDQTKQKAAQAAEATRKVVSMASLFAFFALVIGAIASWFGGRFGTVTPTVSAAAVETTRRV